MKFLSFDFIILFLLFFFALIAHAFVLKFIFPGYYSPLTPHHSDFYLSVFFANTTHYSFAELMVLPRPVSILFLTFIGQFGIWGSNIWVIVLVCLNCSLSTLTIKRIFNLPVNIIFWFVFLIYCFCVFSQPYFYTFYSHDIGAQLSFFFVILGTYFFCLKFINNTLQGSIVLFISCLLAFLSKETYALTCIWLAGFWFVFYRKISFYQSILPLFLIITSLFIVFFFNIFSNSLFINLSNGLDSPYLISFSPFAILNEIYLYLTEAINLANLLLFCLLSYQLFKEDKKKISLYLFIACLISFLFSIFPNALIPNHHNSGYSFNGTYILYLPILFLITLENSKYYKLIIILVLSLVISSPLLNISKYNDKHNLWILEQENIQRNIIHELNLLINVSSG